MHKLFHGEAEEAQFHVNFKSSNFAISALTLLVGCREEHPACKRLSDEVLAWFSLSPASALASLVGLSLVPAYPGCPGKEAIRRVSVTLSVCQDSN